MYSLLKTRNLVFLFVAIIGLHTVAFAGDEPNVLVFNEDSDKDSVPNNSRVHKRVLRAIDNQLGDMGIASYDETTVGLDQGFARGRTRRSDAEIIDISRSISRPPIDVAVIYSIYASAKATDYITKVKVRIEGRMLNVKTGRNLGAFEVNTPKEWTAPAKCNRECILETIGEDAKIIANDLGAVLAEKLAWMVDGDGGDSSSNSSGGLPMAYTLEFNGFTPEEMMAMEEYLVIFSGYKGHRPIYSGARRSEIWYESSIKSAKLTRNLNKMLAELDLRGLVQFSGNTVKIEKIVLRGKPSKIDKKGW
jgi:hypothetical protein